MEITATPGYSPPLHVNHREDEDLLVLGGAVTVCAGGELFPLATGESASFPRDVAHTFVVEGGVPAQLRWTSTRDGIDRLHVAVGDASDTARYARVAEIFRIEVIGPGLAPGRQPVLTWDPGTMSSEPSGQRIHALCPPS